MLSPDPLIREDPLFVFFVSTSGLWVSAIKRPLKNLFVQYGKAVSDVRAMTWQPAISLSCPHVATFGVEAFFIAGIEIL